MRNVVHVDTIKCICCFTPFFMIASVCIVIYMYYDVICIYVFHVYMFIANVFVHCHCSLFKCHNYVTLLSMEVIKNTYLVLTSKIAQV